MLMLSHTATCHVQGVPPFLGGGHFALAKSHSQCVSVPCVCAKANQILVPRAAVLFMVAELSWRLRKKKRSLKRLWSEVGEHETRPWFILVHWWLRFHGHISQVGVDWDLGPVSMAFFFIGTNSRRLELLLQGEHPGVP